MRRKSECISADSPSTGISSEKTPDVAISSDKYDFGVQPTLQKSTLPGTTFQLLPTPQWQTFQPLPQVQPQWQNFQPLPQVQQQQLHLQHLLQQQLQQHLLQLHLQHLQPLPQLPPPQQISQLLKTPQVPEMT
jgi:hypothetical protein